MNKKSCISQWMAIVCACLFLFSIGSVIHAQSNKTTEGFTANGISVPSKSISYTSFHYWDKLDGQGTAITVIEPQKIYGELYYVGTAGFCSYLLNTGDGLLLFDTTGEEEILSKHIEKLGFASKDVKWIFDTHYHNDHAGGNYGIVKKSKAKIYIHERGIERLDLGLGKGKIPLDCEMVGLKGGETINCGKYKIFVIYTPGHSQDSCCFSFDIPGEHGTKKALVMGDASGVLCDVAWQKKEGYEGGGRDYRKTIPLMKTLEFDLLLAGHPWQIVKETNTDGNPFVSREDYYRFLDNRYKLADKFLKLHPKYE